MMYLKVTYSVASFTVAIAEAGFYKPSDNMEEFINRLDLSELGSIDDLLTMNVAVSYKGDKKPSMKTKLKYIDFQAALMRYLKGRACERVFGHRDYNELTEDEELYFEMETGRRLGVDLKQYNII